MFPAASQLVPFAVKSCRQIVPPVLATLIAAGLISAYNRAFSTHLQQPRMSALHQAVAAEGATAPITTVGMTKPPAPPAPAVTETITIYEEAVAPERLAEKDAGEEAGKDQSAMKVAEPVAAPAPVRVANPAPRVGPKAEPHRIASLEAAQPVQPVLRAPAPVIVAVAPPVIAPPAAAPVVVMPAPVQPQFQPPPVIAAAPPMVTVPDRANARPIEETQVQAPPRAQGPLGTFVHVMKPSTWFAAAREFGQKIEDTGNDILPSIRQ
jgi:hypothetical protein